MAPVLPENSPGKPEEFPRWQGRAEGLALGISIPGQNFWGIEWGREIKSLLLGSKDAVSCHCH